MILPTIRETCFTAIDFESAGTGRGRTDAPVQVGLASWSLKGGVTQPFVSFLHCEEKITWAASKVHGITRDDLTEAPTLLSLWPTLKRRLSIGPLVAHGHGTEKRFLRAFPGHPFGPWIDTLQLARAAWPDADSHALGDLCEELKLTDSEAFRQASDRTWHDALYDSVASLLILKHLVNLLDLADRPVEVLLHPDTSVWHRSRHRS